MNTLNFSFHLPKAMYLLHCLFKILSYDDITSIRWWGVIWFLSKSRTSKNVGNDISFQSGSVCLWKHIVHMAFPKIYYMVAFKYNKS